MRNLRFETEHYYFCGNCENELRGYPFGCRIGDRRPLCGRCTKEAVRQGVAERLQDEEGMGRKVVLLFCICILLFIIGTAFATTKIWNR